jgi:hypothetical protein
VEPLAREALEKTSPGTPEYERRKDLLESILPGTPSENPSNR